MYTTITANQFRFVLHIIRCMCVIKIFVETLAVRYVCLVLDLISIVYHLLSNFVYSAYMCVRARVCVSMFVCTYANFKCVCRLHKMCVCLPQKKMKLLWSIETTVAHEIADS